VDRHRSAISVHRVLFRIQETGMRTFLR
jgi:hypothetical protein